jgi:hypothetical protein
VTLPEHVAQVLPDAYVHGYHVAFFWGAVLLAIALGVVLIFVNAGKDDIPTEHGEVAAAA